MNTKNLIIVITLLGMVCIVFGCISTNKHYQGNGLSFDYSANWQLVNNSSEQQGNSEILIRGTAKNNEGGNDVFSISRTSAGNITEADFNSQMSGAGWTKLTVDGVDAYKLSQHPFGDPSLDSVKVLFLKNGMIYEISSLSSSSLNNVDAIVNSIHII